MTKLSLSLLVLCILAASHAGAGVITNLPASAYLQMPAVNYFGPGPITNGDVTWSSTNANIGGGSVYGYTGGYGFGGNGIWDGKLGPMAGLNDGFADTGTMTFAFGTPVSIIGGFINYVPGGTNPTTIAVYDSTHTLIESYDLSFVVGSGFNLGQTLGFQEDSATISYFTLTGNYIGIAGSSVPEPGSMILLGSGILLAIGLGRRRFSR